MLALYGGLALYGLSTRMIIESNLGNVPWDVLHQGLALKLGISVGLATILMSGVVMLAWIPLRKHMRVGLGTVSNAILVGVFMDVWGLVLPTPGDSGALNGWPLAIVYLIAGIVLNALATALYIVPNFGPGPRDGLMTGLVVATGKPVLVVRSGIEIVVMVAGFFMGGRLFVGTFAYALLVGPLTDVFLRVGERLIGPADPFTSDDA